jgi:hypothetical protein
MANLAFIGGSRNEPALREQGKHLFDVYGDTLYRDGKRVAWIDTD